MLSLCINLPDIVPPPMEIEEFQLEFTVLPGSSERGKDKLLDNQGYSFSQEKKSRADTKRWRCIQKGFVNA